MVYKSQLFVLIVSITCSFVTLAQSPRSIKFEKVPTENGFISGAQSEDKKVMIFKGIPYAAPPVGERRWKEPQSVKNWNDVRKCETFGPNAMQGKPVPFAVYTEEFLIPAKEPIEEDCLYLNVWTGAQSVDEKRPVIVYIHGGAFISGSGSVPIYDGEAMARKGIVFVTINYRLGIFGFFSHPELTRESPHHASGNQGILDQLAALKWVKKNIAAFGGDPSNVTIAGQSAGAMSVNILDASPLGRGLFAKMIAESGANVVKGQFGGIMSLDTGEAKGLQIAKAAGAATLEELRNTPAEKLLPLYKGFGTVIVDGYVLPESIPSIFKNGKQADLPLLTGYNADDNFFPGPTNLTAYKENLKKQFGDDSDKVFQLYGANNDEEVKVAANNLSRDAGFGVQNYGWSRIQSDRAKAKVYLYFFSRKVPEFGGTNKFGAFHTGEVMYAYDNLKFLNRPLEPADFELAKLMSSYWVNFAKTGDPNGKGLPVWPAFNKDKGEAMTFDAASVATKHPFLAGLEFLYQRAIK